MPTNTPPSLVPPPMITTAPGRAVTGGFSANDPDAGAALTFSQGTTPPFPANATLDTATGLVTFTPARSQIGSNQIRVDVSDGQGGSANATWTVEVRDNSPRFLPSLPPPVFQGRAYSFYFHAEDDENDALQWALVPDPHPTGAQINAATGRLTWNCPASQPLGSVNVDIRVSQVNDSTRNVTQTFPLSVMSPPPGPPGPPAPPMARARALQGNSLAGKNGAGRSKKRAPATR